MQRVRRRLPAVVIAVAALAVALGAALAGAVPAGAAPTVAAHAKAVPAAIQAKAVPAAASAKAKPKPKPKPKTKTKTKPKTKPKPKPEGTALLGTQMQFSFAPVDNGTRTAITAASVTTPLPAGSYMFVTVSGLGIPPQLRIGGGAPPSQANSWLAEDAVTPAYGYLPGDKVYFTFAEKGQKVDQITVTFVAGAAPLVTNSANTPGAPLALPHLLKVKFVIDQVPTRKGVRMEKMHTLDCPSGTVLNLAWAGPHAPPHSVRHANGCRAINRLLKKLGKLTFHKGDQLYFNLWAPGHIIQLFGANVVG